MDIPFKVSARAARLIGAENIANAESAIIELLKNSWDADANYSLLYFEHVFEGNQTVFSPKEYEILKGYLGFKEYSRYVVKSSGMFAFEESLIEATKDARAIGIEFHRWVNDLCNIWIIDDGLGMEKETVINYWMTIGTNNKLKDPITKKYSRIKSGAKGIGRFALDKLGRETILSIYPDKEYFKDHDRGKYLVWKNKWDEFVAEGTTLDSVKATLDDVKINGNFHKNICPGYILENPLDLEESGVVICCRDNNEAWGKARQKKLKSSLETLIPPSDDEKYRIKFFSNRFPELNDDISSSVNSNFDYKVFASLHSRDGVPTVSLEMFRNEFDVTKISDEFYIDERAINGGFTKESMKSEVLVKDIPLQEFIPKVDSQTIYSNVGNFTFEYFFSKQASPQKNDLKTFPYKQYELSQRKAWSETFGGVRIFRDHFRVRPYGEKGTAEDWLGLGSRAASSPASIGNQDGGWRVRPGQFSGVLKISRLNNKSLEDKSSREGLMENQAFSLLKLVALRMIAYFETDRASLGALFKQLKKDSEELDPKEADEIADSVLSPPKKDAGVDSKTKSSPGGDTPPSQDGGASNDNEKAMQTLAKSYQRQKEEIEELKEEQSLLRGLATIGTISSSLSHELMNLHGALIGRFNPIENTLNLAKEKVIEDEPFQIKVEKTLRAVGVYKSQDSSLKDWINFTLLGVKKDKRRRRKVLLSSYFQKFRSVWAKKFESREIDFDYQVEGDDVSIRCFEIDLDSIFNNLVVNSVEAFVENESTPERKISVFASVVNRKLKIIYRDSGPGLAKGVKPSDIFQCFFTTKRNKYSGEEEGTGIGMWMVKSTVNEYKGSVEVLDDGLGFGLEINFPVLHGSK